MKQFLPPFSLLLLVVAAAGQNQFCTFVGTGVTKADTVSQYGVTFYFDQAYPVGQFANGDFWVVGPVTVKQITPDFNGKINGFELNSYHYVENGFDFRLSNFNASLVPALPLKVSGVSTIIKAISTPENYTNPSANTPYLVTAVVLTILSDIPTDNGATVFRPPYFGPDKILMSTDKIRWDLLPGVAIPSEVHPWYVPTLSWVVQRFQRVQLDNRYDWTGVNWHPIDNMPNYGASIAADTATAALRLLVNDVKNGTNGTCAVVQFLQYSIDLYGMLLGNNSWPPNGGHGNGRKLPSVLGAYLLNWTDFSTLILKRVQVLTTFSEDSEIWESPNAPVVLWGVGINECASEKEYWYNVNHPEGGGFGHYCRDPYGYIDGTGTPGSSYQMCCTSMPWKAQFVTLNIIDELQPMWGNTLMFQYVRRWVSSGAWTLPDPCAPTDNIDANYGITYGPDGKGSCIKGSGRFPKLNGTNANAGYYYSEFADAMYPYFVPK